MQNFSDVQILLSTYNGEKYLAEQLESYARQDYPAEKIHLLVRDDGSMDNTVNILQRWAEYHKNMQVLEGTQLGYVKSFFQLVMKSDPACSYWGVSDQDDVWFENKVSRAVKHLSEYPDELPVLYCSNITVVDNTLKRIIDADRQALGKNISKDLSFQHALVECIVQGCVIFFNKAMRSLLLRGLNNDSILGHDYWCGLVASGLGKIIYDPVPTMYYRCHSGSFVGNAWNGGKLTLWRHRLRFFRRHYLSRARLKQTQYFLQIYGALLPKDVKEAAENFVDRSLCNRIRCFFTPPFHRALAADQFLFRVLFLLNLL